ncbi:hypothetical protein R3P38DRAFT_562970 [Favolaschia claudopus]|uniref:NADH dehydrogenase subunit 4L n=1 Tax=Favolaschia claudopus TaxID=2862362 RepID=A0AAV9ZA20_9AGAR
MRFWSWRVGNEDEVTRFEFSLVFFFLVFFALLCAPRIFSSLLALVTVALDILYVSFSLFLRFFLPPSPSSSFLFSLLFSCPLSFICFDVR